MPDDNFNYLVSKTLERKLQLQMNSLAERPGMTRDNPEYTALAQRLDGVGRAIDDYEAENRVTDEQGKLLKPPATRTPAMFQPEDQEKYSWYFEPSVREAREALKRDPALLQRLDKTGDYSRAAPTQTQVYTAEPGILQTVQQGAGETWLDRLSDSDQLYKDYAEHAWKQRLEKARSRYEGVKRYKDVPLEGNAWEYIKGGARKGEHKFGVPGMLGAADAMSAGQASPLYDVGRDLINYQIGKLSPEEQEVASAMGFSPREIEDLPSSQDIINRSVPAYMMGNLVAGGFRGNPSNIMQEATASALGYGGGGIGSSIARGAAMLGEDGLPRMAGNIGSAMARAGETVGGKTAISGATGAVTNAAEGGISDFSRALNENASPADAAEYAFGNVPINLLAGGLGGVTGEIIGQTAGTLRNNYREQERMRPIKPFEEAGGELQFGLNAVKPTKEMEAYRLAANQPGAVGTAGERAAAEVAPDIQRSYEGRARQNQEDIEAKKQQYFEHPAYRDREISAGPAIGGLVELARRGWAKGPVTGAPRNVDMGKINRLGKIIKEYTDEPFVLRNKLAREFAKEHGGTVIDGELANQLYKFEPGKEVMPGFSVVAVPINLTAENLTHLEELIDEELKMASKAGSSKDPIWNRLNRDVKGMRDQFPYYVDENDNLIPPPGWVDPSIPPKPPSSGDEPVYQAEFVDSTRRPPPMDIEGPVPPSSGPPSGGAGGGGLPEGGGGLALPPAIPRLDTSDDTPLSLLAGNKILLNQGADARALPAAPITPRSGQNISPEELALQQHDIDEFLRKDREMNAPEIEPRRGEDQRKDYFTREREAREAHWAEQAQIKERAESLRKQAKEAQKAGEYEEASRLRKAAHDADMEQIASIRRRQQEGDAEIDAFSNMLTRADEAIKNDDAIVTVGREAPKADDRGDLERMLDDQLAQAPKVPTQEIEEIGALQTADREQVASNQKDYLEKHLSPGSEARAREAAKIGKLAENQQVVEEAMAELNNIDRRLGPIPEGQKRDMLRSVLSKKLGETFTDEDLIRAGIIAGTAGLGFAYDTITDDEDGKGSAVAAVVGGLFGGRRGRRGPPGPPSEKPPRELTVEDNGETYKGFSALRHKQHQATTELERTKQRLGVNEFETIKDRVRTFNQRKDRMDEDAALLEEAQRIGKEKELRGAAGAAVYQQLRDRSTWGGGEGAWKGTWDAVRMRADNPLGKVAGAERNPYAAGPPGMMDDYFRRLLNLTGGRGYRYGDEIRMLIEEAMRDQAQEGPSQ